MTNSGAARVIAGIALAGVSLIAAVVSYLHGLDVVQAVGARGPVAYLIPFLADLVILGASASLLDASRRGQRMPALPAVSLTVGVGTTVAMNVAAGWSHGAGGRLVAGWPAVAFILALESLAGIVRRGRDGRDGRTAPATYSHAEAQPGDPVEMVRQLVGVYGSQRRAAEELRIPRDHLRKLIAPPAGVAALNGQGAHE